MRRWLLCLCARLLRPVIDEMARQQWEEDKAAMDFAQAHAWASAQVCMVRAALGQNEEMMH